MSIERTVAGRSSNAWRRHPRSGRRRGPPVWQFLLNLAVYCRYPRLIRRFRQRTGKFPDVAFPRTIQEKFLWRKVFDRNPFFSRVSDKLEAKAHAVSVCPELKVPEVLWVGASLDEAPADLLRRPGVLKANHGSALNRFLPCPETGYGELRKKTRKWLSAPHGRRKGEWSYLHIPRKLFIEEFLRGRDGAAATEYKVHVCNGKAVWVLFTKGGHGAGRIGTFFRHDGTVHDEPNRFSCEIRATDPDPAFFPILAMAERLAGDADYIRCDFYDVDNVIYFGEFTVFTASGFPRVTNPRLLADWNVTWDLRNSWFMRTRQTGWRAAYVRVLAGWMDEAA